MIEQLKIQDPDTDQVWRLLDNAGFIDITEQLFESVRAISTNQVVKSQYFDLLDGTRAIEVSNPKLDTGLINLLEEEVAFDTGLPQSPQSVAAIHSKLLGLFMSWLNNSSLPVTVLSCRYVQTLLTNFERLAADSSISFANKCSLVNERLPLKTRGKADADASQGKESTQAYVERIMVHKVLKSFIVGLCKFIGTCLYISTNVLYEEEDLTTRNMNFDFFLNVDASIVIKELQSSINWLGKNIEDKAVSSVLTHQLNIIIFLNQIDSVFYLPIHLFKQQRDISSQIVFLKEASKSIEIVSSYQNPTEVPSASFSKFVQLDLDNKNIPFELYQIPEKESWAKLSSMFETIHAFVLKSSQFSNFNELMNYLVIDIGHDIQNIGVIARGVFQLYLIRDDKSIYGDPNVSLNTFTVNAIDNVVGQSNTLLNLNELVLGSLKEETKIQIEERLNQLLIDLESGMYHNLTVYGNNPCRQQQLRSRGLLIWDNLQVSWESFEVEMHQLFNIGNDLVGGEIALPISSFVYYSKLQMMIDLALGGIDLDIYKNFELYLIYWYSSYLIQLLIEHVQGRVSQVLIGKAHQIEKVIPKKIKKVKAGPKKEQLKASNQYNHEVILPEIDRTQNYHSLYLIPSLIALNDLLEASRIFMIVLSSFNLIDYLQGPKNSLTKFENLYNLRLKPWSSIGVPSLPTFKQYQNSLDVKYLSQKLNYTPLLRIIEEKLQSSKVAHQQLLKDIEENDTIKGQFANTTDSMTKWYNDLIKVSIGHSVEVKKLAKLIESTELSEITPEKYSLEVSQGYHKYFPKIIVEEK
ncbi:glucose-repressible protein [Suhomyces tanzawaensis NRRL Y-17324]|uniref:Glucose-repressible protein n=1 Tax=Suhomyces tanzawaensis NRRL Y-17324 TaxID=984487 RepID=A0A1E4SG46_9ASCO|nr:glucose-repressible protein [Suhomyces tanzawaensis NRRL Y-17324]ODV78484.1 glucose-repressible protein [Suhomyces tanzawaensis NRRL Y-17324]